ncbi:MAG: RNA-binding S4 domain-containing protein [Oscillospiraceae bacterium]|nr:RNA-binding S4 domain-containing protein [Oscillospiraceae bacterium]
MRIDKFLKNARIIKRRTVANEACNNQRIVVNGKQVKASYQVKINDIIEVYFGNRILKVKVLSVNEHASKETAADQYQIIED